MVLGLIEWQPYEAVKSHLGKKEVLRQQHLLLQQDFPVSLEGLQDKLRTKILNCLGLASTEQYQPVRRHLVLLEQV